MRAWLLAALMTTIALAGCASEPAPPGADGGTEPEPVLEDAVAALAAGNVSANLELLGAFEQTGAEADAWGDYLFLDTGATVRILERVFEPDGGVGFSEVAAVAAPSVEDVKVSDDGQWMFVGDDEEGSVPGVTSEVDPAVNGGIYVYYVGDKAAPELTEFFPVGPRRGPHMVFYHQQADGTELVFGANADISINAFDRDTGTLAELSRYAPDYVTDVARSPDTLDAYYQTYAHDMFVMEDNRSGEARTLMYVANWDAGLRIVDVTDPAAPVELGAWNDFPAGHSGNLHTVATEWVGERRITVGSVEVGFDVVGGVPYALNQEKSVLYVWDTTDPADVRLVGQWENPDGLPPGQSGIVAPTATGDEVLSTHNFQLEEGIVYLAHYGLGIFVLDVRTPETQAAPEILAYTDVGNTWDVIVAGGIVMGSGGYGLAAYGFPLLEAGPDGLFSRA